eukprot:8053020-Lingulodinium_polyedra.AAC.1
MTAARRVQYARHWEAEPRSRAGGGGGCAALEIDVGPARPWAIDEAAIPALGARNLSPECQVLTSRADQDGAEAWITR